MPGLRLKGSLRVQGLPHQMTDPSFAAAVGLALFAAHPQDEWWDFEMPADRYPPRSIRRWTPPRSTATSSVTRTRR